MFLLGFFYLLCCALDHFFPPHFNLSLAFALFALVYSGVSEFNACSALCTVFVFRVTPETDSAQLQVCISFCATLHPMSLFLCSPESLHTQCKAYGLLQVIAILPCRACGHAEHVSSRGDVMFLPWSSSCGFPLCF